MRKYVIGCDNAAVDLKNILIKFLTDKGVEVENVGCDSADDPTNYPTVAKRLCDKIIESNYEKRGILVCGTGLGMEICANKFKGIRAAVCHDVFSAQRSVLSNNCNVFCFGARVVAPQLATMLLDGIYDLEYVDGPSTPKINEIIGLDEENMK